MRRFIILIVLAGLVVGMTILVQDRLVLRSDSWAAVVKSALVDLTNKNRIAQKIPFLKINPVLEQAAALKAQDMSQKGYFAHVSPEGKTPWYWLDQVKYDYTYAGENLAINFFDSKEVADAWMNSPAHRANMVNKNFKEIGIALARGIYQNQETVFVVQFFATPVKASISSASIPVKIQKSNLSSVAIKSLSWLSDPFTKNQVEIPQDGQNASVEKSF